jgi:hypothetical protein
MTRRGPQNHLDTQQQEKKLEVSDNILNIEGHVLRNRIIEPSQGENMTQFEEVETRLN